jgi:hypothetical protein
MKLLLSPRLVPVLQAASKVSLRNLFASKRGTEPNRHYHPQERYLKPLSCAS